MTIREQALQIVFRSKSEMRVSKEDTINEIESLVKQAQQETADKILKRVKTFRETIPLNVEQIQGVDLAISTIEDFKKSL